MKTTALLAGIALVLNMGMGILNLASNAARMGPRLVPLYLGGQAVWLFAQACMVAFFFTFYARAKE